MDRGRKMLRKLIFPHPALVVLTAAAAAIALTWAFSDGAEGSPGVYGAYTLSAYGLTLVCVRVPALVRGVRRLVREEPRIRRCMDDAGLRTGLTLIPSVAANGGYALLQLGLGILNRSVWYYALSAYYGLLLLMRCTLLLKMGRSGLGKDLRGEYRLFLGCGGVLTVMNAALAVIVSYMVWQNRGFTHHPITTIAMAAYTFYTLTMAVINVVRCRRYNSPVLSASKTVGLAAALVSMLSLETAMLNAFGSGDDRAFRQVMLGASGGAVCLAVLAMGLYMMVRAAKELGRLKKGVLDYDA